LEITEDYMKLTDPSEVQERAEQIYKKFFDEATPLAIPINSSIREGLKDKYLCQIFDNDTFAEAQHSIFMLLKQDSFPRFLKSDSYKQFALDRETKLKAILSTPALLDQFRQYIRESDAPNLDFWVKAEHYKNIDTPEDMQAMAEKITKTFFEPRCKVDVAEPILKELKDKFIYQIFDENSFVDAQRWVFSYLNVEYLTSFMGTEAYRKRHKRKQFKIPRSINELLHEFQQQKQKKSSKIQ